MNDEDMPMWLWIAMPVAWLAFTVLMLMVA
jgi:hypothetical protein